jgi:membrane protease YdiL (CAAX protease family)
MSDALTTLPHAPADAPPPTRPGRPLLAWLVIAAAGVFLLWPRRADEAARRRAAVEMMEAQARSIVGLPALFGGKSAESALKQAKTLDRGTYGQRLRYAVLAGELGGPKEGRAALHHLEELAREAGYEPSADEAEATALLLRLYAEGGPRPLTEDEQDWLRSRLGWFGDLALALPGGPRAAERGAVLERARRAALASLLTVGGGICFWLLGGVLALVFLILALRQLRGGDPFAAGRNGRIYAETFALWLALFVGLSWSASLLPLGRWRVLWAGVGMLLSLAALAWPVLRGVPWATVRAEVGLGAGGRPGREAAWGLPVYAGAFFLFGFGVLAMYGLMRLDAVLRGPEGPFEPPRGPTHPATDWVLRGGWPGLIGTFFAAAVAAPIVEETMFRGVLYRHLREATGRWGRVAATLASAVVVSFVFAAIHPQGWLGVPPLMALALAFSLAREWRGWLPAPMVAHGLHNAALLALLLLTAG